MKLEERLVIAQLERTMVNRDYRNKPLNTGRSFGLGAFQTSTKDREAEIIGKNTELLEEAAQWVIDNHPHNFKFLDDMRNLLVYNTIAEQLKNVKGFYLTKPKHIKEKSAMDRLKTSTQAIRIMEVYLRHKHKDVVGIKHVCSEHYQPVLSRLQDMIRRDKRAKMLQKYYADLEK